MDLTRREILLVSAAATLAGCRPAAVPEKEDAMASTESEFRALLESRSEAVRTRDLVRLMSLYAHDVVYFDVVPPLQFAGTEALRSRFSEWLGGYQGPIDFATRDLKIWENGDLAFASMFHRARGTLKDGREVGSWVRSTVCCQRSTAGWLITHEHVSWPIDPKTRSGAMDLEP